MQRLARPLTVTVLDLNGDAAKDVTEKIGDEALQADLSDYEVLDSLRVKADVVVNNAGSQRVARIEDFPPERFSVMLRLMLKAPFRIVRAALPGRYEKGWGRVINVSSVHGMRVSPYKAAYVAAKHGLEGFSKVFVGGRSARRNFELRLSGLGQNAARREPNRRSSQGPGHSRV